MLSIADLSKVYPNGTHALSRVSFDVAHGEIVAVVGGSGCGKTTLLRLLAGLEQKSGGSIRLDGEEVSGTDRRVGVVFQESRLLPWLSVADNIAFGLDAMPSSERSDRVERMLSLIGLNGYGGRLVKELSGGQAQRVSLARSLVTRPELILLDEPFSALDAMTRKSLHDVLRALWSLDKPTMILVTHDVEEAVSLADRILVFQPAPGRLYSEVRMVEDGERRIHGSAVGTVLAALNRSMAPPDHQPSPAAAMWW